MKKALILCLGLLAACGGEPEPADIERSEEEEFRATWEFARLDVRSTGEMNSLGSDIYEWTLTHDDELVDISSARWYLEYTEGGGEWVCAFSGGSPQRPSHTDDDLRTAEGIANISGTPLLVIDREGTILAEYCDLHLCIEPRMRIENRLSSTPYSITSYLELDPICEPLY
jgi:hypothetical protein